mmetsp:Transcript_1088/g.2370  ORF Transcript_1088/g.2370 Transcript_1088/m.2370 type:complete len:709 (+) Transcript_1088:80-2206(+)
MVGPRTTAVAIAAAIAASFSGAEAAGGRAVHGALTIVSATDATKCLAVSGREVVLKNCLDGEGVAWMGSTDSPQRDSLLGIEAVEITGGEVSEVRRRLLEEVTFDTQEPVASPNPVECFRAVSDTFMLWPCAETTTRWSWDPTTLQLKTGGKCLAVDDEKLALQDCEVLGGSLGDDSRNTEQNGHGAPPKQTWVLLPTNREQVDLLDTIKLPLRAAGRYIGDASGRRIKLVGVTWSTAAQPPQGISKRDFEPPPERVAKLLRFMGFNSVRIAFSLSTSMVKLDDLVEAATSEGLLVVLARHNEQMEFADEDSKKSWLEALKSVGERYKDNDRVVGIDLHQGPQLEETKAELPFWGVAPVERLVAQVVGVNLVDWRQAAAEGALAVWEGDPHALVVIEGGLYGTDLNNIASRPLTFGQECLNTRVVYGMQEKRWSAALYDFYNRMAEFWNPVEMYDELEQAVSEALLAEKREATGEGSLPTLPQQTYEEYAGIRSKAAYYLDEHGEAPLWISAFSTSKKSGNDWWENTLRLLEESDASWFYSPLGSGTERYDGLFDIAAPNVQSIVGWKLQDLAAVQGYNPLHPETVKVAEPCSFEKAANLEAVQSTLTLNQFLATADLSSNLVTGSLLILAVALTLCCACCFCCCCRRRKGVAPVEAPAEVERPRPKKNLWCCACQRELPLQVPAGVANVLPQSMLVDSSKKTYSQLT